jgi:UDP-N-acetylmuramoylalanine--D-glutamate ligase
LHEQEIRGKTFSVLGGARSGLAVAALLRGRGASVFLSDSAPAEKMRPAQVELEALGIPYEFGENSRRVLEADALVLSPGVPSDAAIVREALALDKPVLSEIEVAAWFSPAPILAITGTNGKTTTTALLGRVFEDARRPAVVGGNIGTAFSQCIGRLTGEMTAILEVSSFQLDHIVTFRPKVALLLNITPDHLDRYDHSFERYIASKCRIFENQGSGDVLIYNRDDAVTRRAVGERAKSGIQLLPFTQKERVSAGAFLDGDRLTLAIDGRVIDLIDVGDISLRGAHNLYNVMAASLAAKVVGIPTASLRATIRNFKGVEHRLEFVRELEGVTYVNDSKATNVDSVWYALQSFTSPIVLMLGGRDKGNDYAPLTDLVRRNVRAVIAIGESAEKVKRAFAGIVPVTQCGSMDEAVEAGCRLALRGDIVLLSPACASFDWFQNYEHRGRVFKECVKKLGTMS